MVTKTDLDEARAELQRLQSRVAIERGSSASIAAWDKARRRLESMVAQLAAQSSGAIRAAKDEAERLKRRAAETGSTNDVVCAQAARKRLEQLDPSTKQICTRDFAGRPAELLARLRDALARVKAERYASDESAVKPDLLAREESLSRAIAALQAQGVAS
jgi:hypothetical protein